MLQVILRQQESVAHGCDLTGNSFGGYGLNVSAGRNIVEEIRAFTTNTRSAVSCNGNDLVAEQVCTRNDYVFVRWWMAILSYIYITQMVTEGRFRYGAQLLEITPLEFGRILCTELRHRRGRS